MNERHLPPDSPIVNLSNEQLRHIESLLKNASLDQIDALNTYIGFVAEYNYRKGFFQGDFIIRNVKERGQISDTDIYRRVMDFRNEYPLSMSPDGWTAIEKGKIIEKCSPLERLQTERCDINWCEIENELCKRKAKC